MRASIVVAAASFACACHGDEPVTLTLPRGIDDRSLVFATTAIGRSAVVPISEGLDVPSGDRPSITLVDGRELRRTCFRDVDEAAAAIEDGLDGPVRVTAELIPSVRYALDSPGLGSATTVAVAPSSTREARLLTSPNRVVMGYGRWCLDWTDLACGRLDGAWTARRLGDVPGLRSPQISSSGGCARLGESLHCWKWADGPGDAWPSMGSEGLVAAPEVRSFDIAGDRACGLTSAGEVACWHVGDARVETRAYAGLQPSSIDAGHDHFCVRGRDRSLCFGGEFGTFEKPLWIEGSASAGENMVCVSEPSRVVCFGELNAVAARWSPTTYEGRPATERREPVVGLVEVGARSFCEARECVVVGERCGDDGCKVSGKPVRGDAGDLDVCREWSCAPYFGKLTSSVECGASGCRPLSNEHHTEFHCVEP